MTRTLNFTAPAIRDGVQQTVLTISTAKATDRYDVLAWADDMALEVELNHQGDDSRKYVVRCDHKGKPLVCSCPAWKFSGAQKVCRHTAACAKLVEIGVIKPWEKL
jgi:hypothetical protein